VGWYASAMVAKYSEATLGPRLVMFVLAQYAEDDGTKVFPSVTTLCTQTRLSRRAVQYALQKLVEMGEIEAVGMTKKGCTIWRLLCAPEWGGANTAPVQSTTAGGANPAPRGAQSLHPGGANPAPDLSVNGHGDSPQGTLHPLADSRAAEVRAVFEAWKEATGRNGGTKLTEERRDLIRRKLKQYPADDLIAAVRGWRHFPHNRGENERGTPYNDLALCLRDAAHIERFRDAERQEPWAQGEATGTKADQRQAKIDEALDRARELAAMGR
jgi:hypothetical protein